MEQYCIYLRKSRGDIEAEARGEGETLIRHEHALSELAKYLNFNIKAIYREIMSGETIAARPVMQQLLQEVADGIWAGVLVMEVERLARGETMDQGLVAQAFKYSNTKIITPLKIYDPGNESDEEYFEFNLFMSRREYKTINRRLQRGRIASVKEGKFCGNKTPYGYERIKLENEKGYILNIIPDEADIVKMIFLLFTTGEQESDGTSAPMSIKQIADRLNSINIKPKYSDKWVPSTIREILSNVVYIGKIRWARRKSIKKMVEGHIKISRPRACESEQIIAEGRHTAIIDNEIFNHAQQLLKQNSHKSRKNIKTKNPLAGLIICGICGKKMIRRLYNNRCRDTLLCYSEGCKNISTDLNIVESKLINALKEWLKFKIDFSTAQTESEDKTNDINKILIKRYEREIKKTEFQINNLYDLFEQKIYSADTFKERYGQLQEKVINLKKEKSISEQKLKQKLKLKLMIKENKNDAKADNASNIYDENLMDIYKKIQSPEKKNEFLTAIIDKAVYIKTVNGRWHNSPDNFTLMIYPKI